MHSTQKFKQLLKSGIQAFGYDLVSRPTQPMRQRGAAAADVIIIGPYLIHNFGDDLIGAVLAKYIQRGGRSVGIPNLGRSNADWLQLIYSKRYERVRSHSPALVIGGGGLLGDAGRTPTSRYLELALGAAKKAKRAGRPIVITGVGAGPLSIKEHRAMCRQLCLHADAIGVRDAESKNFLVNEIKIPESKITAGADVALLWPEHLAVKSKPNGLIGIQCDPAGFIVEQKAHTVFTGFRNFASLNWRDVVMVSNGANSTQLYSEADLLVPEHKYSYLPTFLSNLSGLRAIVTTHLHLSIAAFACRIPCFSIYVREKTKRFYAQIGREERAVPAEEASLEQIARLLDAASNANWSSYDEDRLTALKSEARRIIAPIDRLLCS